MAGGSHSLSFHSPLSLAAPGIASPGLREKRPDIVFAGDLTDSPIEAWADEIDHAIMHGNRITTEVVFFHRQSGTAIFTDQIQQLPVGGSKAGGQ